MMVLYKSNLVLTAYMKKDKTFGPFLQQISDEHQRTVKNILCIARIDILMQNQVVDWISIIAREEIIVPLLCIQQFALQKLQDLNACENSCEKLMQTYQKIVARSLYGNTNAARNSA